MSEIHKEFIRFIAKHLVDNPASISIEETSPDENTIELRLKVDKTDIGQVIGKHGHTANSMRILLTAISAKGGKRAKLIILD